MIAASIAQDLGYFKAVGFLNDVIEIGAEIGNYKKIKVIGKTEDLDKFLKLKNTYFFIAYVGLQNEKQTYKKIETLNIPPERYATLIHPTAIIPIPLPPSIINFFMFLPFYSLILNHF
ncbi:hypothetical protein ES703_87514 [subsurface metagenome]